MEFFDCRSCGDSVCDCSGFFWCEQCSVKLCESCENKFECGNSAPYDYDEYDSYEDQFPDDESRNCPYCKMDQILDSDLLSYVLKVKIKMKKEDLKEEYRTYYKNKKK